MKVHQTKSPNDANIDFIYRNYIDDLYSYALSLGFDKQTSMDAIHDIFYKFCMKQNLLENVNDIKFFMLRSLRNRLIDICRSKKEYVDFFPEEISEKIPFIINISIEDQIIQTEEDETNRKKIEEILENLSDRQREIIYLRYIQEYDYEKIAEIMQISVPSCHKLVYKTLLKIRETNSFLFLLLSTQSIHNVLPPQC